MSNPLISFLQHYRFFPAEEQDAIDAVFERRHYKEGDQLLNIGSICRELFFICDGVLRIMSTNQKGIELTHFFS